MNLPMVPIAMSKGHIDADAYGGAVQYSTKRINSVRLNLANFKVPKRSLFLQKLATWCFHLRKEPIAAIPSNPRPNALFW